MSDKGYESPEAAVLAEWDQHPDAEVRVVEVRFTDARNAVVITDTEPSHRMTKLHNAYRVWMGVHRRPQLSA